MECTRQVPIESKEAKHHHCKRTVYLCKQISVHRSGHYTDSFVNTRICFLLKLHTVASVTGNEI